VYATPQVDSSQIGVALLATQAGACALVAGALVVLDRTYRRPFLAHWSRSWIALTLHHAGAATLAATAGEAEGAARVWLSAATLIAGYLQVAWLLSGTLQLVRGRVLGKSVRPWLVLVPAALGGLSVFWTVASSPEVRQLARDTLPSLLSGVAFLLAAVGMTRQAWHGGTPSRWFAAVLFGLLSANLLQRGGTQLVHPGGGFVDPLRLLFLPSAVALVLQLLLVASLLLLFFEDERRALARTAELLATSEEQRRRSEHMEAVGRLAGGVAHDFNNLLTAITGHAELLLARTPDGHPDREDLLPIARAASRAAELVRGLLTFSRRLPTHPRPFVFDRLLAGLRKMLERLAGENVAFELDLGAPGAVLLADPGALELALINLTTNARDAIVGAGHLSLRTSVEILPAQNPILLPPGRVLHLEVADSGCGIADDRLDRIFEPFYTTKPGKGTGLGLASVYGIVKQCGGEIQVESASGLGTRFHVWLPLHPGSAGAEEQMELAPALFGRGGRETILLVEDDPDVRVLTQRQLVKAGYRVFAAENADQAAAILREGAEAFDLVLSDVVMPGRSTRSFLDELATQHPELRVLLMSGYSGSSLQQRGIELSSEPFLAKPFRGEELLAKVRRVLDSPRRQAATR